MNNETMLIQVSIAVFKRDRTPLCKQSRNRNFSEIFAINRIFKKARDIFLNSHDRRNRQLKRKKKFLAQKNWSQRLVYILQDFFRYFANKKKFAYIAMISLRLSFQILIQKNATILYKGKDPLLSRFCNVLYTTDTCKVLLSTQLTIFILITMGPKFEEK